MRLRLIAAILGTMKTEPCRRSDNTTCYQAHYQIRVQGHLDQRWATWFQGMTITHETSGETVLSGLVVDQAALHGLLACVRDLGLTLLSVSRVEGKTCAQG